MCLMKVFQTPSGGSVTFIKINVVFLSKTTNNKRSNTHMVTDYVIQKTTWYAMLFLDQIRRSDDAI